MSFDTRPKPDRESMWVYCEMHRSRIGHTTTNRGLAATGTTGLVVGQFLERENTTIHVKGDYLIGLGVRSTTTAGLAGGSVAARTITVPEVIDDCLSPQHTDSNEDETDPPATHETRSPTFKSLTKPTEKGVGLRVADSYTGNHLEDGFTPLKTIRRLLVVIGRRSHSGFEGEAFKPERMHCGLSAKELNEFLSFYPIPSEYDVILTISTQTIFDDPPGYYFKVHIFWLNPFGCAKLTTFINVCKAYGYEPSVDLFREMAFRNFIYTEDDDDLDFLPKEPSLGFGTGSSSASVNTELPKDVKEPEVQPTEITADSGESLKAGVFIVNPGSVAARIKERKCKTREGSSRPHIKRKLAFGSSSSRVVHAKTSASKDDALILSISDNDEGKFLVHLVLYEVIEKMRGEGDVIKAMERSCEEECEELRVKCEAAMAEFDQNLVVLALREKISSLIVDVKEHKEVEKPRLEAVDASLRREVEKLKQDRRDVVSKFVPYAAIELVAAMKEPFDLSKAKGYRSSYKKEHTQDSNDFATGTFLWLDEFVADAAAPIEALFFKKPPTLQKPAPSRTQMHVPFS
nr:hypothetical protein [Tanacetum cinerariifolium]